jgi:glycogen operon protein
VKWDDSLFGYKVGQDDLSFDDRDSARLLPWPPSSTRRSPGTIARRTPWHKTFIYEMHVKGFTMRHPGVPENLRGTYAGLASDAVIKHLKDLNITAIELLPVHHHLNDRHLEERKLTNYWGYNTLSFFAPQASFDDTTNALSPVRIQDDGPRVEAGIEVILTSSTTTAEGNQLGPTLSCGIDNAAYYRLSRRVPATTWTSPVAETR